MSDAMARFAEAVVTAAAKTNGLVDGTLLAEIESAGYRADLTTSVPLANALELAPPRRPASPSPKRRWEQISVDRARRTVARPRRPARQRRHLQGACGRPAGEGSRHSTFAVEAAGDVRVGGSKGIPRPVQVASPFDRSILHKFSLVDAGVATSGIGRRSWLRPDGSPAHHLLDPATGEHCLHRGGAGDRGGHHRPRGRGARAAVLGGPEAAPGWLPDGGVLVLEDARPRGGGAGLELRLRLP